MKPPPISQAITVYHNRDFLKYSVFLEPPVLAELLPLLEMVAEVKATTLEEAFALTNNIDHPWIQNVAVQPAAGILAKGAARSTSVGDVLHTADGNWYMIVAFGFCKI